MHVNPRVQVSTVKTPSWGLRGTIIVASPESAPDHIITAIRSLETVYLMLNCYLASNIDQDK